MNLTELAMIGNNIDSSGIVEGVLEIKVPWGWILVGLVCSYLLIGRPGMAGALKVIKLSIV